MTSTGVFGERLERAIAHLTPEQEHALLATNPDAKGVKAALALVTGMPGPNTLSDILSGRVPGNKYRQPLAVAVATDLAWLEGTGDVPPDWAISPVAAWRRYAQRLSDAAQRGRFLIGRDQSTLPVATGNVHERLEAESLARVLACDPRDPCLVDLVKGRYTTPPIELLWRYGEHLGLATPAHARHLAQGRELWHACKDEMDAMLAQATDRFRRMLPPPPLFRLMRAALVDRRQSLLYQGDETLAIEDAMELLWVQQWFMHGKSRLQIPKAFTDETGRRHWSKLRDVQMRYAGDQDIEGRHRARRIGT